jgi:hypothetical protein
MRAIGVQFSDTSAPARAFALSAGGLEFSRPNIVSTRAEFKKTLTSKRGIREVADGVERRDDHIVRPFDALDRRQKVVNPRVKRGITKARLTEGFELEPWTYTVPSTTKDLTPWWAKAAPTNMRFTRIAILKVRIDLLN